MTSFNQRWTESNHGNNSSIFFLFFCYPFSLFVFFINPTHPYYETEIRFLAVSNDETRIYVFSAPRWVLTKGPQKKSVLKNLKNGHFSPFLPIFDHFLLFKTRFLYAKFFQDRFFQGPLISTQEGVLKPLMGVPAYV